MRRFAATVCLLALLALLPAGCAKSGPGEDTVDRAALLPTSSELTNKLNNGTDYKNLIQKTYDEDDIVKEYLDYSVIDGSMGITQLFSQVNAHYPAECLRQIEDNFFYALYRTKQGGLFYMFYADDGRGVYLKYTLYSKKRLSKSDFSQVKLGTTLAEVTEIDPAAAYAAATVKENYELYQTYHLLTDSVLSIIYTNEDGVMRATTITYYDDFRQKKKSTDTRAMFDFNILKKDYIR